MVITEKISTNRKLGHIIFNDSPDNARSYSSYLLLKDVYRDLDVSFGEEDWHYYFIVRRHFLRKKRKENGGFWVCHYCGEVITKMQERNVIKRQPGCVTIDHVVPVSDPDCDKLDTSNMVECCETCNIKKGNMSYDEFNRQTRTKKTNTRW
jgi:5-methylcytosine-specific restriction endonuclease McrA